MRTYHINLNRADFENIESDGELLIFLDDGNRLSLEFEEDE